MGHHAWRGRGPVGRWLVRGLLSLAVVACAALFHAGALRAQQPATPPAALPPKPRPAPPPAPQSAHALDAADLESWLDGMLPAALQQGDVAGAVVSVVKDGHVLLAKGYGLADAARHLPMDADSTLVRPGSTSKLFTWTAVMQLAEAGKLDLHADINRYLDFRIPEPYGPITLDELMMHRGGFEEGLKDAIAPTPSQLEPLGTFLRRHIRPVLFPPGKVPAYSNYGTALAGYIVERVSGEPFDRYVQRHIFGPLGMRRSTFTQPLPALPGATMAQGYMDATQPPRPFELISFAPAGALSTTATDMARFMLAHLGDGRLGDAQILRPETARLMHSPSFAAPPGFDVMAHGFFRDQRNGHVVLEHGGDTIVFHSSLNLLPDAGVGLFVSFNSRGRDDAVYGMRDRLINGFMDRYFNAAPPATPPAIGNAQADAARVAGRYETSRRVEHGFMSLFYVLQGQEVVAANPDGTITLSSSPAKPFREVAPGRWQEVGGARVLAMSVDGGTATIADSRNPTSVLQRAPLRRNAGVNLLVFALSFIVLLGGVAGWAIAEGSRRAWRQPPALAGRALLARRLARIATLADLGYLVAWFLVLKPILGNDVSFYTTARDPLIRTLEIAGIVPVLGAVAGVVNAILTLRSPRGWALKLASVLIAAALLGVLWIAWVGGLISLTLNY